MSDKNIDSLGICVCVCVCVFGGGGEGELSQFDLSAVFCSIVQPFESQDNV